MSVWACIAAFASTLHHDDFLVSCKVIGLTNTTSPAKSQRYLSTWWKYPCPGQNCSLERCLRNWLLHCVQPVCTPAGRKRRLTRTRLHHVSRGRWFQSAWTPQGAEGPGSAVLAASHAHVVW